MKKIILILTLSLLGRFNIGAQSFELMLGHERVFIDAQYLKYFNNDYKWSLFSRARANTVYDKNPATDLFTAGYLNYTIKNGIGLSVVGRISSLGKGIDLGPHFLKKLNSWKIFILPSINLNDKLLYSWFSIIKYEPKLSKNTLLYTSYEQFSAFNGQGHLTSVQRIRLAINSNRLKFIYGIAMNFRESGTDFSAFDSNIGIFIKKEF